MVGTVSMDYYVTRVLLPISSRKEASSSLIPPLVTLALKMDYFFASSQKIENYSNIALFNLWHTIRVLKIEQRIYQNYLMETWSRRKDAWSEIMQLDWNFISGERFLRLRDLMASDEDSLTLCFLPCWLRLYSFREPNVTFI